MAQCDWKYTITQEDGPVGLLCCSFGLMMYAQIHIYQTSSVRIALDLLAVLLSVICENIAFATIFETCSLSFPLWLAGLGSSARAQSAREEPAVYRENDSNGKLQKAQRFRQRRKLI